MAEEIELWTPDSGFDPEDINNKAEQIVLESFEGNTEYSEIEKPKEQRRNFARYNEDIIPLDKNNKGGKGIMNDILL